MPLQTGDTFAGYRVLRFLGEGGMGEVYLARHPRLPREDALKVLRPDISDDESFRERFVREADLASQLRHPNIVGVHDRGEFEGQLWIAMDYVEGTDAAHLIRQRYPAGMPIGLVMLIATAVARALDYAHKKGLLHRDVKPANIIVGGIDTDEPTVSLADFGIARPVDDTSGLTTTNMTVGTVAYAAPEQLMGESVDGRSDQYALAATTYSLLTGSELYPHSNPAVVISRHLNAAPPKLGKEYRDLSGLDAVLEIALSKDAANRYPSCATFARALAGAAEADAKVLPSAPTQAASLGRAHGGGSERSSTHRESPRSEARLSRGGLLAAGVVVTVLLIGGAAIAVRPWESQESSTTTSAVPPPLASSAASVAPVPSIPPPSPPPAPLFSAEAIDSVFLNDDQLSSLLGTMVTDNPAGGGAGGLALGASSYGTSDRAGQVTPRSCVGVVFTGEHDVYDVSGADRIKNQTFGSVYGGLAGHPHLLAQTVAVFPSAEEAELFVSQAHTRWNSCSAGDVDATLGYENSASYALGAVDRSGEILTVSMAANGGLNGPDACQHVMGIRDNVVVETRTCEVPDIPGVSGPNYGFPRDPAWAVPDAERVALAMLDNVVP